MAIAVAWAAAKSTEATEQEYDENDEEYQTYRHRKSLHFMLKELCLSKLGIEQLNQTCPGQSSQHA
jgi:hypothetical protein